VSGPMNETQKGLAQRRAAREDREEGTDGSLMNLAGRRQFHERTGLGQNLRLLLEGGDRKVQNGSDTVVRIDGCRVVVMIDRLMMGGRRIVVVMTVSLA